MVTVKEVESALIRVHGKKQYEIMSKALSMPTIANAAVYKLFMLYNFPLGSTERDLQKIMQTLEDSGWRVE